MVSSLVVPHSIKCCTRKRAAPTITSFPHKTGSVSVTPVTVPGAGLPGLVFACGGLLGWWRRHDAGSEVLEPSKSRSHAHGGRRCNNGDLKVDAAAVHDESSQDNEKHHCSCDRPPVIFAPPWVGPPAVVAARKTTSVFKVWVYHIRVRDSSP